MSAIFMFKYVEINSCFLWLYALYWASAAFQFLELIHRWQDSLDEGSARRKPST
jgi:hypothetical protein